MTPMRPSRNAWGNGLRHLGLGQHDVCASVFFHLGGAHFLFQGHSQGATFFGVSLGDAQVGRGLVRLKVSADVGAHVDFGDVNGHDLEGGLRVEGVVQHGLRNQVGVRQHVCMVFGACRWP